MEIINGIMVITTGPRTNDSSMMMLLLKSQTTGCLNKMNLLSCYKQGLTYLSHGSHYHVDIASPQ